MHSDRLADDETILNQLPDLLTWKLKLTGVGVGNLIGLVGVQPYLLLATAQNARGKPLLEPEHAERQSTALGLWIKYNPNCRTKTQLQK
uniref:Uncharacterized protein n=1 Tax=Gadus morhua TaxID=8049 RepID=A0A8C5CCY9_GADMO